MRTASKHPKLPNGQPAISCFGLSSLMLGQRTDRAAERFNQATSRLPNNLTDSERVEEIYAAARAILWYPDFPTGLLLLVSDNELFRLTADLPSQLEEANGGRALDFWDYAYVADVLREWLAQRTLPGEVQALRRALAWVEREGNKLYSYSHES